MADTPFNARNGLVANAAFTANSTQVSLGSNVIITPSTVTILTGTSNVVLNATAVFVGNSTVNSTINSTSVALLTLNTAAQFAWSNTHNFTGSIAFSNTVNFNGTVNFAGNILNSILTDAATVNWDMTSQGQFGTLFIAGNRTFAAPTNLKVGTYILQVVQDATGSRTITWNSVFKWVQGTAPVLSTIGGRRDIISFICDGVNLYGSFLPDVR